MHKDQRRILNHLMPLIQKQVENPTPEAQRDCTILNRALIQGPDPLFLMEMCPTEFAELCRALDLTIESGREAIEQAHWQGPGIFLAEDGQGIPLDFQGGFENLPEIWRREALWLFLASLSDCTEEGYGAKVSFATRLQKVVASTSKLSRRASPGRTLADIMFPALRAMKTFKESCSFVQDERGFVHDTHDHSFYVAYKLGHQICAVHTTGGTFWGTTPKTTLQEHNIQVDIEISPQFGLVLDNSLAVLSTLAAR